MDNIETAKMVAKHKLRLWGLVVFMLILVGTASEYLRMNKPLNEAYVVVYGGQHHAVEPLVVAPQEPQMTEENVAKAVENANAVGELLQYMKEIHQKAEAVTKPQSALGQVNIPVVQEVVNTEPVPVVNERVVEVYDEAGEVVEIVEAAGMPADENGEVSGAHEANQQGVSVEQYIAGNESDETPQPEVSIEQENANAGEPVNLLEGQVAEVVNSVTENVVEIATDVQENLQQQEAAAESLINNEVNDEVIVNTQENQQEVIEIENDAPAIDMMKDIIAREQANAN